jgi:hypothetical protein
MIIFNILKNKTCSKPTGMDVSEKTGQNYRPSLISCPILKATAHA